MAYREVVPSTFVSAILAVSGALLIAGGAYTWYLHVSVAPYILFITGAFEFLMAINFSRLIIESGPDRMVFRYGILSFKLPWNQISGCYIEKKPFYTGGVKYVYISGKKRLMYSVPRLQQVVIRLRERKSLDEFSFSTTNPDGVLQEIKYHSGCQVIDNK